MYKCNYFDIHELVPKDVYEKYGETAWKLMDDRILITIDKLRYRYGKMTINNYYWGGDRQWSGLRTPDSPYYNFTSQHSYGRAVDIIFKEVTTEEVRNDLLNNPDEDTFKLITAVELDVSWLHIDVRNVKRLFTFRP